MKYTFSVAQDFVRTVKDPIHPQIRVIHAYVNVNDLPNDLPLDPDPRRPKEKGEVPNRIVNSLIANDGRFHLLNRGITISCEQCEFDNRVGEITLTIPPNGLYGIIDGGHTYNSIRKSTKVSSAHLRSGNSEEKERGFPFLDKQFVHLEILERVEPYLADIAEARNFSVALKKTTLANYRHKFDWLIQALGETEARKNIRLSENDEQPINILDVVQVLGAVNPVLFPDERPAHDAYKSAGKILGYFIDDEDPYEFKKMSNVARDILFLYDFVRLHFQDKYNAPDETGKRGLFGATKEAKDSQQKRGARAKATYYWLDPSEPKKGNFVIDKGFAIPLISGFRVLLKKDEQGMFEWLTDPVELFTRYGNRLVRAIMNASNESGSEPWSVARDPQVYRQLTSEVRRWYLEGQFEQSTQATIEFK